MGKIIEGLNVVTLSSEGSIIHYDSSNPRVIESYFKRYDIDVNKNPSIEVQLAEDKEKNKLVSDALGEQSSFTPKPEELLRKPFRMLSATTVASGSWRATEFPEHVLRKSMPLLVTKPAFTDHWQYGNNFIGSIEGVEWGKKATIKDPFGKDILVPAGINGVFLIDGKMNERLARALSMNPPGVQSCSVTVEFLWKSSHEFDSDNEFYRMIGKEINGEQVRKIATIIPNYHECSVLWMGADPYAKVLDSQGNPINIDYTSTYEKLSKFEKDLLENDKKYFVSCSYQKDGFTLKAEKDSNTSHSDMEEILKLIKAALGVKDEDKLTAEQISEVQLSINDKGELTVGKYSDDELPSKKIKTLTDQLTAKTKEYDDLVKDGSDPESEVVKLNQSLKSENKELQNDNAKLELTIRENEPLVKQAKEQIELKRKEAIRLYKVATGDKFKQEVVDLFEKAEDASTLDGLIEANLKKASEKYSATCEKCGSHEFSFQSSIHTEGEGADQVEDLDTVLDNISRK